MAVDTCKSSKVFCSPFFWQSHCQFYFYRGSTTKLCFSVLNWPPWRVFSDFTLKWNCWRDTDICEDSTSSNVDCSGLGISNQGFTRFYWTKSMVCSLFGSTASTYFPCLSNGAARRIGNSMVFLGQRETQLCNCSTWGTQRFAVNPFHLSPYRRLGQYLLLMAHPVADGPL